MNNGIVNVGTAGVAGPFPPANPSASPMYSHFTLSPVTPIPAPTPMINAATVVVQELSSAGPVQSILSTPDGSGLVTQSPTITPVPVQDEPAQS